jgi:peroxiredoxin
MLRIRSLGILTGTLLLLSFLTITTQAQHRPRLKAPKALLDVFDPEDRACVLQSGLSRSVTVRPVRLAADKSQQLLIRGSGLCLCGAQNCGFWIYRQTGPKYELLLKGAGSTKVKAGTQRAKGYRDVISESHASAMETIVRTYRYDGSQYQPLRCVNRAYYDDNGKYTNRPINRPCEAEAKNENYVSVPANIRDQELMTIDDRQLRLSDYAGRIIVISLPASWCAPCLESIPELGKINQSNKTVQVIGVVSKVNDPQMESVRHLKDTLNVNFPLVWENVGFTDSISKAVEGPSVLPQIFLIDKEGRIRKHFTGYNPANTAPLLRAALEEIRREDSTH